jgi:hypothetical protein
VNSVFWSKQTNHCGTGTFCETKMASLLKGATLLTPTGEPFKGSLEGERGFLLLAFAKVESRSNAATGKYLMLYFSASWW